MINLKRKTLRSTNNFINLTLLGIIILLNWLFISTTKHGTTYCISLRIIETILEFIPIYYFYKQFSNKGKYINILPVSMKKAYIISFIDWLIIYVISVFIVFLLNKIHYGNDMRFYTTNVSYIINQIISTLKINFMIISGIIIVKFYKKNWILVLAEFIAIFKIIDLIGEYCIVGQYREININIWGKIIYSTVDIGVLILLSIVFFFMTTKLDKLSIE